jgi:uncharacterized protein YijF (DUF1287 family)
MDVLSSVRPLVWTLVVFAVGCSRPLSFRVSPPEIKRRVARATNKVFQGALAQLEEPATYDAGYYSIPYPGGDVPQDRGACADVVVRAYRHAGVDLQKLKRSSSVGTERSSPLRSRPRPSANGGQATS